MAGIERDNPVLKDMLLKGIVKLRSQARSGPLDNGA